LYEVRRSFPIDPAEDPAHPLDAVHNAEEVFGSYLELTRKARAARAGSALPNA
jgi:hypothetical protein